MNPQENIRTILREEINNQYHKNIKIRISNILSVNSDGQSLKDAIINVKDGLSSYSQEPPLLLKMGNKYEILDGFHRIAQKILNGDRYIVADVIIKEPKITLKESIRRILREEFDIYNSENYLEDFYAMDFMEEMYNEKEALRLIQKQIDYIQDIKYPIKVYRGIDTKNPQEDYSGEHWTTDVRVAEGFGDKIFVGLITNQDSIDIEQTIRTRVMNPYEYEITVPNFDDVKILDIYNI